MAIDKIYDDYKNYIPKNEEELIKKMGEYDFKGRYYKNERGNINWVINNITCEIILDNQYKEAYIISFVGSHDHVPMDELWKYLKELNSEDEIIVEKNYEKLVKKDKIGNIFVMIFINILTFGFCGAFVDNMVKGKIEFMIIFGAILFLVMDILLIYYFYKISKK